MWAYPEEYDVIVIGAGHAGCEAAHASARMGARTLMITMNLDTIGKMSCNPAIGGPAKGHIVREIDALGGIMGKVADRTGIQSRMLNRTKGPAVWSPRVQSDRVQYALHMKHELEKLPFLSLKQGTIESLYFEQGALVGVTTQEGIIYKAKNIVISAGTFMRGLLHIGATQYEGGRAGDKPSNALSRSLEAAGIRLGRLKTGTPPRVNRKSIDFSQLEEQPGEDDVKFSHDGEQKLLPQVSCYITYTSAETKKIILDNLHLSPLYAGIIKSVGPRYCPSIEDKCVRFADKDRHQVFLEPEGIDTEEFYVNGVSTSLPFDVQLKMIRSIPGLEKAEIMRYAYAIEYDYVLSGQLYPTLESIHVPNLFFAGQINGTTGYEEAGAQGIIAGINAALKAFGKAPFILRRSEAYIGVLIDELISKEHKEPYRMFTSRAEHRLLLRQDNADLRLREYGYTLGMISQQQYEKLIFKKSAIEQTLVKLRSTYRDVDGRHTLLSQYLCRPEVSYFDLHTRFPDLIQNFGEEINYQIEIQCKYAGYIERQEKEAHRLESIDHIKIPEDFEIHGVKGLRNEAKEKIARLKPVDLGQVSRMSGISPADISILLIALERRHGSVSKTSTITSTSSQSASI